MLASTKAKAKKEKEKENSKKDNEVSGCDIFLHLSPQLAISERERPCSRRRCGSAGRYRRRRLDQAPIGTRTNREIAGGEIMAERQKTRDYAGFCHCWCSDASATWAPPRTSSMTATRSSITGSRSIMSSTNRGFRPGSIGSCHFFFFSDFYLFVLCALNLRIYPPRSNWSVHQKKKKLVRNGLLVYRSFTAAPLLSWTKTTCT